MNNKPKTFSNRPVPVKTRQNQTKLKFDDSKPESLEDAQPKSPEQKLRVLQHKSSGISRRDRLSEFVSGLFSEGPKMDPQQVAPEQTPREQYLKIAGKFLIAAYDPNE